MNNRIKKVNHLLKQELGNILLREMDFSGVLVTITNVDVSANLQQAKIYVSIMPDNQSDRIFKVLNINIYNIQQELNKRLKMRPVPRIEFKSEEKTKSAADIEKILEKIRVEEKEKN